MKVIMTIHGCQQISQALGSNDEHMISRVFFSLDIGGKKTDNLHADIKQTVGSDFEKSNFEISPPEEYKGQLNYSDFRNSIESYYRSLVGSQGGGIRVPNGGAVNMENNFFPKEMTFEFDANASNAGW